ncbi:hypothetical protein [Legionella shakespearei]|nr:hypothetical protein [Legionella shakespearei]
MEFGAEIIHNHSNDAVERIVCGTGVAVFKETINTAVARPAPLGLLF